MAGGWVSHVQQATEPDACILAAVIGAIAEEMQAVMMGWKRLLGWDGILPALVAMLPWAVTLWLPRNSVSALGLIVLAPIVAALVRAAVGYQQFRSIGFSWPPIWRQVMLGIGISLLLLGEAVVGILALIDDEPIETWLLPVVIYGCYFACIVVAFRPASAPVP